MSGSRLEPEIERPARWPVLPAIVALLVCLGLTIAVVCAGAKPNVSVLSARARQAVASKDDAAAALHFRHLLALEPDAPAHALDLALSTDRLGKRAEAVAILTAVAPANGGGYAPAHLQLAEWLVQQQVLNGAASTTGWQLAGVHARAASNDPKCRSAAMALLDVIEGGRP